MKVAVIKTIDVFILVFTSHIFTALTYKAFSNELPSNHKNIFFNRFYNLLINEKSR